MTAYAWFFMVGSFSRVLMSSGRTPGRRASGLCRACDTLRVEWRLLAGVSAEDVSRLVAVAQRRAFRRGQVVFHDDDPADALHLVVHGHFAVRVTIPTGDT